VARELSKCEGDFFGFTAKGATGSQNRICEALDGLELRESQAPIYTNRHES
jgi:hypothetical protein